VIDIVGNSTRSIYLSAKGQADHPERRAEYRDGRSPCKFVDELRTILVVRRSKPGIDKYEEFKGLLLRCSKYLTACQASKSA